MPELWRSLTWEQGAEMAEHAPLRVETGLPVIFWDRRSPWQRGTNENTNGLLGQYSPQRHRPQQAHRLARDLAAVAATINTWPRKTLG